MLHPASAVPEERENKTKQLLLQILGFTPFKYTMERERERPDRDHMVPVSVTCDLEGSHVTS